MFAGSLNEPGTVTVQGVPATVAATNAFRGGFRCAAGTNEITVAARDASGNQTTQGFEVEVAGQARTFTHDANGNVTSDGSRSFEWDARNQLISATVGGFTEEFTYDGLQRRVRIVKKENGTTISDVRVIWVASDIAEERATDGVTLTRRVFARGEQLGTGSRFFTYDHLGSVAEVTSGSTLLSRYA